MLFCYYFLSFLDLLCNFFLILSKCSIFPFHLNLWLSIIYLLQPSSSNALLLLSYSGSMRRLHQWCLFHALLLLISLFLGFTATTVLLSVLKPGPARRVDPGPGRPGPGTGPGGGKNPLGSWPGETRSTRRVDPGPGPPGQTRARPGVLEFDLGLEILRIRVGFPFFPSSPDN